MLEKRKIYLWLIASCLVNLGLGLWCLCIAFCAHEIDFTPCHEVRAENMATTNADVLAKMRVLSYQEIVQCLSSQDLVEEGYTKRDLALTALVSLHHFDIERALGPELKERCVYNEYTLFPALEDYHYALITHFIENERWPFTPEGLFLKIKERLPHFDSSLLEAFTMTKEVQAAARLFTRSNAPIHINVLLSMIMEGEYTFLTQINETLSPIEARRVFLLHYLRAGSRFAAKIYFDIDRDYILHRFSDADIVQLMGLVNVDDAFKDALATSLRSLRVRGQEKEVQQKTKSALDRDVVHVVENGENLWKIARQYHTTVQKLIEYNQLETERIRPGRMLKIPQ